LGKVTARSPFLRWDILPLSILFLKMRGMGMSFYSRPEIDINNRRDNVLAQMLETSLQQSRLIFRGSWLIFFNRPIAGFFMVLAIDDADE
jgi:hypothetical protein